MKKNSPALAALVLLLALACPTPAQPWNVRSAGDIASPDPVNLDIPPQVIPSPEEVQDRQLAEHGIHLPEIIHQLLLQLDPTRGLREQLAAFSFLRPDDFRRAHPETPDEIQAEAIAAHAVLNFRFSHSIP